jgi:hypothetical protein
MSKWTTRVGLMLGGTLLGLVGAEGLAYVLDNGAFSHLHVYAADDVLGTRLRPGETQWVQPGSKNPPTYVRINGDGFRGADWPAGDGPEIVVVGDSQVFGLGVEEDDTTPAALGRALGRPVRNAGVPTYGPDEYLAVAERVLASRDVSDLVVVFNMANDLFELDSPNRDRHAVWDGWAVRIETAPDSVTSFPGRDWLYRRSHLFFALRRAWHARQPELRAGLPSEGGVSAVVEALATEVLPPTNQTWRREQAQAYQRAHERPAGSALAMLTLYRSLPGVVDNDLDLLIDATMRDAHPGDIVHDRYAEAGRSIEVTAALLRKGAQLRAQMPTALAEWAVANPDDARVGKVRQLLGDDFADRAAAASLARETPSGLRVGPLVDWVREVRELAFRHGARPHLVVLPLDVQVSEAEFAKYGAEPVDMSETTALLNSVVAEARLEGVHALSLMSALEAAEPGAFLFGDLHMAPKGHAAAAEAIAAQIRDPSPVVAPQGMPEGRTRVPLDVEYDAVGENLVRGSSANACETKEIREWLRLRCGADRRGGGPMGVALDAASTEAFGFVADGMWTLYLPLVEGRDVDVGVQFADGFQDLQVRWDGDRSLAFAPADARPLSPLVQRGDRQVFGAARACADDVCLQGIREVLPDCEPGHANAGSAGWCLPVCDAGRPCAVGTCGDWQGLSVCL